MSRKSIHKLIINDVSEYQFFGIVTSEADYKISLKLNQLFNLNLKSDKAAKNPKGDNKVFNRFVHRSEFSDNNYQLVSNKTDRSTLSSLYPAFDYLFLICGVNRDYAGVKEKIFTIPEVTAVFILDNEKMTEEYLLLQIS